MGEFTKTATMYLIVLKALSYWGNEGLCRLPICHDVLYRRTEENLASLPRLFFLFQSELWCKMSFMHLSLNVGKYSSSERMWSFTESLDFLITLSIFESFVWYAKNNLIDTPFSICVQNFAQTLDILALFVYCDVK